MASPGWLNENEGRAYPFLDIAQPSTALPESVIVDFGAILGFDSGFEADVHAIYLHRITRDGEDFEFEFRTTSPDCLDEALEFSRSLDDDEFAVSWADSRPLAMLSASSSVSAESNAVSGCLTDPKWSGFLITGQLGPLVDLIPDGESVYFPAADWRIEPTRAQSLLLQQLRSVSLANYDRTLSRPPPICEDAEDEDEDGPTVHINSFCLQGDLTFVEGYNVSIRQDDANNKLVIGAVKGAGAGEPCEEFAFYPGEPSNEDDVGVPTSALFSGGPSCNGVIKTINGVGGRHVKLIADPGITIGALQSEAIVDGLPYPKGTLIVRVAAAEFANSVPGNE